MEEDKKRKIGRRRLAREIALRVLFQLESAEDLSPKETFDLFCDNFCPREDIEEVLECGENDYQKALPFAWDLFSGVTSHREELDRRLNAASENWRLDRMSRVDRNILRLSLFELLYRDDIPPKVSLNEAIELGKNFGSEDSGSFINGILDRIHKQLTPVRGEE